jgi:hypothetical protein
LNIKFSEQRVVGVHIIFGKVIERNPSLEEQGFFKHVIGVIKGVSGNQFGDIEFIIAI